MSDSNPRFELLRARYAASLTRKREALAAAWDAFVADPHDAELRRELQTQIHRLSGSALAYGYERLGESARAADAMLRDWDESSVSLRAPPADLAARLEAPLRAVFDELSAAAAAAPSLAPAERARLRVLLVDDDAVQAMFGAAELDARGCDVRIERGADGLRQGLSLWPCHAVVLDYWLRGETAAEIAAMLRREPRFAHVALICFSAERDPQLLRAVLAAGCDAVVAKADGFGRLLDAIRECVARPDRSGRAFVR
ncbi:MAG TPA: response regulator [Dokdonella sp.]